MALNLSFTVFVSPSAFPSPLWLYTEHTMWRFSNSSQNCLKSFPMQTEP